MPDLNYLVWVRTMVVLFCASAATTATMLIAIAPFVTA